MRILGSPGSAGRKNAVGNLSAAPAEGDAWSQPDSNLPAACYLLTRVAGRVHFEFANLTPGEQVVAIWRWEPPPAVKTHRRSVHVGQATTPLAEFFSRAGAGRMEIQASRRHLARRQTDEIHFRHGIASRRERNPVRIDSEDKQCLQEHVEGHFALPGNQLKMQACIWRADPNHDFARIIIGRFWITRSRGGEEYDQGRTDQRKSPAE